MTKTLTTEILKAYAEKFRKDSARWAETGEPEKAMELNAVATEFDALAANWEAQPVIAAWQHKGEPWRIILDRDIEEVRKHSGSWNPLYTAPPAPVVNPEFTGATAVPVLITEDEQEEAVSDGYADSFRGGWNACRAAMLATAKGGASD